MERTVLGLCLVFAFGAVGCAAVAMDREATMAVARDGLVASQEHAGAVDRLVTRSASASVACAEPAEAARQAESLAKTEGGWAQTVGERHAVLRVPDGKLEAFLDALSALGDVTDEEISAEDVTLEYRDTGIRLANLENAHRRYTELLARAENVQAALAVEKELERVTGEIEALKGRLRYLESQVRFATIHLRLTAKEFPGPLQWVWIGVSEALTLLWTW